MVNNRESTAVRWVNCWLNFFLPLPPFLLEHRQLAGEQTPSETVSSLDVPRNHLLLNLRNFHRDFTLCTTEFPPSRVYYSPGPRRKGRNVSRRKPITHHAYTLLTLNYRYDDEIGIDLSFANSRDSIPSSFLFFSFLSSFFSRGESRFASNAIIHLFCGVVVDRHVHERFVPRIISRHPPFVSNLFKKDSSLADDSANYKTRPRTARSRDRIKLC